jgi:FAD/FMN-containing dehydrogenase
MSLQEELKKLNAGEILTNTDAYSTDASLFSVQPEVVVVPRNAKDIGRLVEFAREHKGVSLTARSAGTDMTGGPLSESVVLDMTKHFDLVLKVGDGYAITQPGVYYRDFERDTLEKGQLMPSYPASREICTVGGMVANNSGGEKTLTYGQTKNYVQALKVVFSDGKEYLVKPLDAKELEIKMTQEDFEGEIYRKTYDLVVSNQALLEAHKPNVSKNSSGYFLWDVWDGETFDLTKLITGSQGTLSIITEITFKLIRPKAHSKLLVIFLPHLDRLADIATTVLKYKPESFESYDDKTLKLALRFLPSFVKLLGRNIFFLALQFLPEFWMFLTGGMPKLILLAEFTGDTEEEIEEKIRRCHWALQKFHVPMRITHSEEEAQKYWTIRRESFNLLRNHLKGQRTAPFIDDMVVQPKHLPKFLPELEAILKPYNLIYSIAGHVGNGNFHIIPLMKIGDPHMKEIIPELSKKVYDLILKYHGSITGEHNDGLIRTPFLKQMYGEKMYELFEQTKNIFDPQNIFNPGKKVNGNWQFALDHIRTTKS